MEETWRFVWDKLYDDRTGMFYNHLAGDDAHATKYLPKPEIICLNLPNPGGYGTGMEDCMLNAGIMMDAVISRYEATKDEVMREYAERICKGMILDASVSQKKGFLPRGVSPVDCRSHYTDTSRDQYTNWIYGAYRMYYSPLADEKQKDDIRSCISAMSEKFEAEIIPENDYSFLREDGKIGVAGKMWGDINAHEYIRLPMLYLLTWKITGDEHWKNQYLKYRDDAVENTMDMIPFQGATYVALQTQFAVRLVYDLDDDPEIRNSCMKHMQKMASAYEKYAIKEAEMLMTPEGAEWLRIPYTAWQNSKFRYAGIYGGIGYFVPEPSDFREHLSYYPLRAVGESIAVASICPSHRVSEESLEMLCRTAAFVDYEKHRTCAPIALLEGYWRTMASLK